MRATRSHAARRRCTRKRPATSSSKASIKTPGFDAVWAGAHKIVKLEARSRRQNATPMEARAGHAAYDAATGRVTLTCTTQMPHLTRTAIADVLGIAGSRSARHRARRRRRLRPEDVAGARICACWSGWRANYRSSVAWTEDRRENLIAGFHSRDQYVTLEGAFDENAKLIALKADVVANVGAYSCFPTTCGVEPLMAMAEMPGPYDVRPMSAARAASSPTPARWRPIAACRGR